METPEHSPRDVLVPVKMGAITNTGDTMMEGGGSLTYCNNTSQTLGVWKWSSSTEGREGRSNNLIESAKSPYLSSQGGRRGGARRLGPLI